MWWGRGRGRRGGGMVIFVTLTRPWLDRKHTCAQRQRSLTSWRPAVRSVAFLERKKSAAVFSHTLFISFFSSPSPAHLDLLVSPLWRAPPLSCWPCAWPCAWRWRPPVSEGMWDEKKRHARALIVVCCGCAGRSRERLRGDDQHTPDAVNARLMPETGVEWAAGGVARRGEGPILFLGLPRPPSLLF